VALAVAACALAAPAAQAADDPVVADDPAVVETTDVFTGETAVAEETAATEQTCTDPELATPLAAFKDTRSYFLAPGGSFEDAAARAGSWRAERLSPPATSRSAFTAGAARR
jgi:hypothetical protein